MTDRNSHNQEVIAAYRANAPTSDGTLDGRPLLLLTSTGAKSGNPHTTPMIYRREGERIFVFASKGGAPTNPDWYVNLVATPTVTVELGPETFRATATPLGEPERGRIYAEHAEAFPNFAEYQEKTTRPIPVVELVRAEG
ncbi:MAG TPA: nitroreductase family deazaflavin-dependent oxidoreductase [Acidimicrobiales bacterium]|nr:nitroreductase family deazaflavin-dependent oxidoreductase [Acidimicrobiales bacterium]